MELYKGLPLKTITVEDLNGVQQIFGVTTEMVETLLNNYLVDAWNEKYLETGELEEFDSSYSYAVPQKIFEQDDETILKFINNNIDHNFNI